MSTRWLTFDCFGTLVDWNRGFAALLQPLAGTRTPELIRAYHDIERQLEPERPHRSYRHVLTTGLGRAADQIRLPLPEDALHILAERWHTMPVFPDVEPAFADLRAAGWKLAVLTNCDVDLFARTAAQFRHRFDQIVTAEQVQDYKPSLAHFRYFSRLTGAGGAHWIHVACSWYHDIAPTRTLGVRRIWVDREQTGDDPAAATRRIQDLTELPNAVAEVHALP